LANLSNAHLTILGRKHFEAGHIQIYAMLCEDLNLELRFVT